MPEGRTAIGKLNEQKKTTATQDSGTSSQHNTYNWMEAPDNKYFDDAASLIDGYDGGAAAAREGAARNVNAINNAGNDLYGSSTPDYARDKVRESRLFSNNLALGQQLGDANQNEIAYKNQAYMGLGAATAPTLVQTDSNGSYAGTSNSKGTFTPGAIDTGIQTEKLLMGA